MPYKKYILWALGAVFTISLVVYSSVYTRMQRCKSIDVSITNEKQFPFLSKKDIVQLATENGTITVLGKKIKLIDLGELENNVLRNSMVKSCQVNTHRGENLSIVVTFKRPIARLLYGSEGQSKYLNEDGNLFSTSPKYVARVPLITGPLVNSHMAAKVPQSLFSLVRRLDRDPFFSIQITQLEIADSTHIKMVPLVGNHLIEFGDAHNKEDKLSRLKMYYKSIYGSESAAAYTRVNVAYEGQIVCE